MVEEIAIIGAGGHTRSLLNILSILGFKIEGIYDNSFKVDQNELIEGIPLKGLIDDIPSALFKIISKGSCNDRAELFAKYKSKVLKNNIVHPSALIETRDIGIANQVSAMTYISNTACIGNNNIIYSNTSIEHEVKIGDHNVITMNVALCGRVKLGSRVFVGAGASILPSVEVCDDVTIGAGAVVTKNIIESGTYIGIPAKKVKQ